MEDKNEQYIFVALKRKKDNVETVTKTICHRFVSDGDDEKALRDLKNTLKGETGLWRIYRTVNKRNLIKGKEILICDLVTKGDTNLHKIGSRWKSILMKSDCKSERKWLLDIDTKNYSILDQVSTHLKEHNVPILEISRTPNGWHYIVEPFDLGGLAPLHKQLYLEIKRDDLFLIEWFNPSV
jgi:hypothetical protein